MSRPKTGVFKKAKDVKLTYFNLRGRQEKIRLVLAAGGVKYTFQGVERGDWPAMKPSEYKKIGFFAWL